MNINHGDRWNPISVIIAGVQPRDQSNHFSRGTNDVEPGTMDFFRDQWTSSGSKLSWKTINNCFASNNTFNACDGSGQCPACSSETLETGWNESVRQSIQRWEDSPSALPGVYHALKPHLSILQAEGFQRYWEMIRFQTTWHVRLFFVPFCSDDTKVLSRELGSPVCVPSSLSHSVFTTQTWVKTEKELHVVKLQRFLWHMKYLIWNLLQRFGLKQTHQAT